MLEEEDNNTLHELLPPLEEEKKILFPDILEPKIKDPNPKKRGTKPKFFLRKDLINYIDDVSDEEAGQLLKLMLRYQNIGGSDRCKIPVYRHIAYMFRGIIKFFKEDDAEYKEKKDAEIAAGFRGQEEKKRRAKQRKEIEEEKWKKVSLKMIETNEDYDN